MPAKIGLFGGTFDPVHNGHLSIADSFLKSGIIEELWVLLTPYPPHKQNEDHVSYENRLEMLKSAFADLQKTKVNTIENNLPKPSYSVQTIRKLKQQYPRHDFYFCMGEDSLAEFKSWKYYEEILDECELLVAKRPGVDHKEVKKKILEKTHFVDHVPLDISSTEIKAKVKEGKDIRKLVPSGVFSIIEKEQLYR